MSDWIVGLVCRDHNSSTECRCSLNCACVFVSAASQRKASIGWLCHEDCSSGNIWAAAEDKSQWFCIWHIKRERDRENHSLSYLNSMGPSTCASAAVCLLCRLFGAVFDQTSSPKIPDMATVMAEILYLLEIIIVNHRRLKSPGSIWL